MSMHGQMFSVVVLSALAGAASAQRPAPVPTPLPAPTIEVGEPRSLEYTGPDGQRHTATLRQLMRPMCAFADVTTPQTLAKWADMLENDRLGEPVMVMRVNAAGRSDSNPNGPDVVDASGPGGADAGLAPAATGGIEFIFNFFGAVPSGAAEIFELAAAQYAAVFTDDVSYQINVFFDDGSFGAATTASAADFPYESVRGFLVDDMDDDDEVQAFLPSGTLPGRLAIGGPVVALSEVTLLSTLIRALGQTSLFSAFDDPSFVDSSLFIGTDTPDGGGVLNFTTTPEFGFTGGQFSALDIITHEIGHTFGHTSGLSGPVSGRTIPETTTSLNMTVVDFFRFDENDLPPTLDNFETTPRFFDNTADSFGDHAFFDGDTEENLASDVSFQASHWLDSGSNFRGIMDPAIAPNQTRNPTLFSQADLALWDAIGWDLVAAEGPCNPADIATTDGSFGTLDGADIAAFVSAFVAGESAADIAPTAGVIFGILDGADIAAFINAFLTGCP